MLNMKKFNFVLAVLMIFGLAVYGIYWNVQAHKNTKEEGTAQYSRAFGELLENLDDAENYMLKAMASGSPENTSLMLEEVWRSATLAESHLEVLPISQNVMSEISSYIVQLADVCKTFNEQTVYGNAISDEDAEVLSQLYGYAQDINGAFQHMAAGISSGDCSWSDIEKYSVALVNNEEIGEKYSFLQNFSEPMEDYPTLIYDGPFSEHMADVVPKGLKGDNLSKEQAAEKIPSLLPDYKIKKCEFVSENNGASVKVYSYVLTLENNIKGGKDITAYADVTAKGGMLYSLMLYREIGDVYLAADQAVLQGQDFLSAIGFESMEPSYYNIDGGVLTANYCTSENGVFCYPDMVKVNVALDTGDILGVEAERYVMNHCDRSLEEPDISETEAKALLSSKLSVDECKLAVIPNNFGGEHYVYEFNCRLDGRNCLVYIDCESGREREILILQESENGVLVK